MTATDRTARTARGARTRERLLRAAEQVFVELGYHAASIVKITAAAGVGQGTFYLYFAGKQQVFDELVEDLNRQVRRAMAESSALGSTRAEAERFGFEGYFRFVAEHPGVYRIIRQAEIVSPRALRLHYSRILAGYVEGLRAAIDAGEVVDADPEVMAWALMGVGEIIGMRWVLWEDGRPVPAAVLDEVIGFVNRSLGITTAQEAALS